MRQPVPFGKYLLLDRISVGGMAEVFKAKSYGVEGFEKIIAIKRILPTMGEDRDFIKMFIDEAKIAGQLAHANICQIFELGRIDGSHFIAMEYIWGKDLLQIQNRLRKLKQQMPVQMACFAIAKVLEGLDYAHRKRDPLGRPLEIVHRDCSPQNVLVSYEGEVKVIDFGIAKATSRNSRTMAGVLKGKFGYMSPEQVRGLPLDRRSDIFALGTMLYECLTGERLFQGETDFSTLEKVRNVDIQAPRAINPAIPEVVEKVILKALAKDVDDRYQWCSEMLADLQAYLMAQEVVYTAKTLSSWLKEVFSPEIERERQQLEQYKRLGRDGLIQGVPAAEAKLDVVEHLGEAGQPEGDATMLGGPNFDELEQAAGAAPNVDIAPPGRASKQAQAAAAGRDDEDEGDFGEEAPTEIFGDDLGGAQPAAAAEPQRAPSQPTSKPPRPPPGGRPGTQPMQPMAAQQSGRNPGGMPLQDGMAAAMGSQGQGMMQPPYGGQQQYGAPPAYGTPSQQQPALNADGVAQMAMGTPGAMQSQAGASQQKTVLGMQAPQGLGNYGQQQPQGYRANQSQPMQPMQTGMQPGMQSPMQGYPQQGYGAPQGYPGQQGYPPGYATGQMMPYPSGQMPAVPVDPTMMPVAEGKKSTLVRDIGIGVAIAALVLVGFLVVKIFVLDAGSNSAPSAGAATPTTTSTIATVKLSMPPGITAKMFVDDKEIATVEDKTPVPVTAGLRRIKIVGPTGANCDSKVQLEGGKTTTLECVLPSAGPGSAGAGSDTAATGNGSASAATGSAGSADVKTDTKVDTKTDTKADTKADTKTTETKTDTKASSSANGSTTSASTMTANDKTVDKSKNHTDSKTGTQHGKVDTKADTKTDTKADHATTKTGSETATADSSAGDPTKGYLTITSKPVAKILVDGADTGLKTPVSGHALPLAPGKHKITFVIGDDRFSYPVVIKAGSTEAMNKDLQ